MTASFSFSSRTKKTLRLVAAAVVAYHFAAACCLAMLPRRAVLPRSIPQVVREYLQVTGNDNLWNMFHKPPSFHSYHVDLMVRSRGQTHVFGPLLPGLQPFDGSRRAMKLFSNLERSSNSHYLELYLEAARKTVFEMHGIPVERLWLRYRVERLHSLAAMRRTGKIANLEYYQRGL